MNRGWGAFALAGLCVVLGEFRAGVAPLAWAAYVAWLVGVRAAPSDRRALLVLPAAIFAFTVATAKILTAPMPLVFALAYGLPIGLTRGLALVADRVVGKTLPASVRPLVFATAASGLDILQHTCTPLGSWGGLGNAFVHEPALVQATAFIGADGLGFVGYLAAASVAGLLEAQPGSPRAGAWALLPIAVAYVAGALRLGVALERTGETVRVAAVDTDATFAGHPLPSDSEVEALDRVLARRIAEAAAAGARLVVTTEASTLVRPAHLAAFEARMRELARTERVDLVVGYVMPTSTTPLHYANRYLFVRADGSIAHTYTKRQPVPLEPAEVGGRPSPVVQTLYGRVGGAICYDYDAPDFARDHGRRGVDLVVLPASDWRGIDPLHAEMATLRAAENGHAVVRATRFGRHLIADGYGIVRAQRSHFEGAPTVLLADVPTRGVRTVYTRIAGVLRLALGLMALGLLALSASRARPRRPPDTTRPASAG